MPDQNVFRGIVMALLAVVFFSLVDFLSKYLVRFYPIPLVVWARYTFHVLFVVLALGPRERAALVRTARPGIQALRGFLLAFASLLFVAGLRQLPLAESTAIAYLWPLVVALMSVVFLKEKIAPANWLAIVAGFVGVLTIIRPGSAVFSWAALLPLCNAIAFALYQLLTRKLAGIDSPYTSIFYAGLIGSVALTAVLPWFWTPPQSALHAVLLIALGILGGFGHLLMIKATYYGPPSRIAPFAYTQLIWVTLIGFIAFGDFPDHWSLAGIAILMASGIYMAAHQRNADRQRREAEEIAASA